MIDFVVVPGHRGHGKNRRHYIDHLAPVWHALPSDIRGEFATCCAELLPEFQRAGIEPVIYADGGAMYRAFKRTTRLTVVAGHGDPIWLDTTCRPNVIMPHGVGFNFDHRHTLQCYPGANQHREFTSLMLSPCERIADIERKGNPEMDVVVVGCPKLDKWHNEPCVFEYHRPVVAFAWHWNCEVCPETRSAWEHFKSALPSVARQYRVIGHGHPHILDQLTPEYEQMGIEVVRSLDEVFQRADVLCFDATSAGYEFASMDKPVVVLNAPWYRRDVDFGLRFWQHADVGVNCDDPNELIAAIGEALEDSADQQSKRRDAIEYAYAFTDGKCAERAAIAISNCYYSQQA